MSVMFVQVIGFVYMCIYFYGVVCGENVVLNDDLIGLIDFSDEWIWQCIGIIMCVCVDKNMDVIDFVMIVVVEVIEKVGVFVDQVDLVIVVMVSNLKQIFLVLVIVVDCVGVNLVVVYDINVVCVGYVYVIVQVDVLIKVGMVCYVFVIGIEKFFDIVDLVDCSILFFFGDGVGVVLIGFSDIFGILFVVWGLDGFKVDVVGMNVIFIEFCDGEVFWFILWQEGLMVFCWVVWEMVKVVCEVLDRVGVELFDIVVFILYQVNMCIIDEFVKQFKLLEIIVIVCDIEMIGNMFVVLILLVSYWLMVEYLEFFGGFVLQIGFGVGFVFVVQVVVFF